jgi:hypothetical protein
MHEEAVCRLEKLRTHQPSASRLPACLQTAMRWRHCFAASGGRLSKLTRQELQRATARGRNAVGSWDSMAGVLHRCMRLAADFRMGLDADCPTPTLVTRNNMEQEAIWAHDLIEMLLAARCALPAEHLNNGGVTKCCCAHEHLNQLKAEL